MKIFLVCLRVKSNTFQSFDRAITWPAAKPAIFLSRGSNSHVPLEKRAVSINTYKTKWVRDSEFTIILYHRKVSFFSPRRGDTGYGVGRNYKVPEGAIGTRHSLCYMIIALMLSPARRGVQPVRPNPQSKLRARVSRNSTVRLNVNWTSILAYPPVMTCLRVSMGSKALINVLA